jgi:hypothetical protein
MKTQLEKLNNLNLDVNLFYAMSIYPECVRMQGRMSSDIIKTIKSAGFELIEMCDVNNFLEFKNNNAIYITLT